MTYHAFFPKYVKRRERRKNEMKRVPYDFSMSGSVGRLMRKGGGCLRQCARGFCAPALFRLQRWNFMSVWVGRTRTTKK